jgi:hypothetical protein
MEIAMAINPPMRHGFAAKGEAPSVQQSFWELQRDNRRWLICRASGMGFYVRA